MKTFVTALTLLSALAGATPTLAQPAAPMLSRYGHGFEAVAPRPILNDGLLRAPVIGSGADEQDTATGGPSGGLADRN